MKRLLVAGVGALMLSACGGGGSAVGANSSESTEITAVGTIVDNETGKAPADNSTVVNTAATVTDNAAVSQEAASANAADDTAVVSNDSSQ